MKKLSALILVVVMNISAQADDGIRPSRLLLNSFANQCPQVVTRNVTATLSSLQSLYSTVEELKKDTNCGGAVAFSAAVSRYTSLYENFETESAEAHDKVKLEKRIALYTELVSDPAISPAQKSYLQTEIVTSQSNLVNIDSNLTRFGNFSGKEARVADQLVRAADDFLTEMQTTQGNACYQKNTAKISSMMSNALLVTAAFASGGTSLALAGGAVIVKSVGKYVGDLKYNKTMDKLQDIEMPTALRCVSQALTDQFCSTNETQELITDRIDTINDSRGVGYEGINLLSYQLSPLSSWLEEVYSGSAITSEGDLTNREKSEIQSEFLRKTATYLETFGTIKRKFFLTLDNENTIKTAISQNIECLVYLIGSPSLNPCGTSPVDYGIDNPIFSIYSRSLFPYELFEPGVHRTIPRCGQNDCTSFSAYVNEYKIAVTLNDWDRVLKNANDIVQTTKNLVNLERSKMISVDAYSIIVNAKREQKGVTSPISGLKKVVANADRITKYLTDLGCKESSDCVGQNNKYSAEIRNIQKTKELTNYIINLVNEGMIPRSIPDDVLPMECAKDKAVVNFVDTEDVIEIKSFQITSCISKILKLQERGTVVYFSKIRNMVSYEMEARLLNNDLGDGVKNVINSTKIDLVQSILNSYSTADSSISLGELNISLESAQNNSKETLNSFFDFFKKNVVESLESAKVTQTEKNDLCLRILPYVFSAKESFIKDIYPICKTATFQTYKNGPMIRFSDYVTMVPKSGLKSAKYIVTNPQEATKYFCGYRKYNRANLLIDEQNKQRHKLEKMN